MMTTTTQAIHPFEAAGLGLAPFRYVGMIDQNIQQTIMGDSVGVLAVVNGVAFITKPGGTCDYCGTFIIDMFRIESADGRRFKVGCECVKKCDAKIAVKVATDAKKAVKARKTAKDKARVQAAIDQLPEVADALRSKPHPMGFAEKTLLDWCEWMLENAGASGRLRVASVIEKIGSRLPGLS